ncbi:Mov34/MPN/PAD-1 family protein (plasmid) [Alkalihalophilus sp. As8PL]|uniref:Mov34/MPN/PAD-1 family protein n=1 Tax=Alkalihalophilus sp. As8PL TaxID=3237103 RepID=A0AB39BMZ5_9BACI
MDLFQTSLFGEETPLQEEKKVEKNKVMAKSAVKEKAEQKKSTPQKKPNDLEGINDETCILYAGFRTEGRMYPLTDLFTDEDIEKGILEEDGKRVKITAEDVRHRLENGIGIDESFPEFVKGFSEVRYDKDKNMLFPSVSGKKKGASPVDALSLCKETLFTFIGIAKQFSEQFGTEIAGDLYQNPDTGEYLLRIPPQTVNKYWVEREHDGELQATHRKLCEIHSHHTMAAFPSQTDNEDDVIPGMIYCIVGMVNHELPHITCRYFDHVQQRHIALDAEEVFDLTLDSIESVEIPSFEGVIFPQVEVVSE